MSWNSYERRAYEAELRLKAALWERLYEELAAVHIAAYEKAETEDLASEKSHSSDGEATP